MWLPVTPLCKPFVCKPFAHLHLHVGAQLLHLAAHSTHPAIPFFSAPARRCTVITSGCTQHPPTHPPSHSFLFCTSTPVHSCYIWLHTAPTHPPTQPFLSFLHLHVGAQLLHLAAHGTHPPSHSFLFCTCTSVHSCNIWLHTAPTHPAIPFFFVSSAPSL